MAAPFSAGGCHRSVTESAVLPTWTGGSGADGTDACVENELHRLQGLGPSWLKACGPVGLERRGADLDGSRSLTKALLLARGAVPPSGVALRAATHHHAEVVAHACRQPHHLVGPLLPAVNLVEALRGARQGGTAGSP